MSVHLKREINNLKKKILSLGRLVEDRVSRAVESVEQRDVALAEELISGDIEIDRMEVEIEEDCLKTLALHQPVAVDLRLIVAVLKMNNDLERIGDLAVNIAERSAFLAAQERLEVPFDLAGMARICRSMLRRSLEALVNLDAELARRVCADDDQVDAINRQMYDQVKDAINRHLGNLDSLIHLLCISRHIERIADLATNIAEDVVYMVEGEIVRHRTEDYNQRNTSNG